MTRNIFFSLVLHNLSFIFCGQINVDEAMKGNLEQYVQRKIENSKKKETQAAGVEKDDEGAKPSDGHEDSKPDVEHSNKEDNDSGNKKSHDVANFGIVTDEDRDVDRDALEKITKMIEERLKTRPLPPPPPAQPAGDGSLSLTSEQPAKTRDGDSDVDTKKNGKGKKHFNCYICYLLSGEQQEYTFFFLLLKLLFRFFVFQIL